MTRQLAVLAAGLALSTSAAAQSQIVFTTSDTRNNQNPGTQDFIGLLDTSAPGAFSTLFTNTDADSRLRRIVQNGADSFLVGDSPFPTGANTGSIFQFQGLLGGAPVQTVNVDGTGLFLDPNGIAIGSGYNVFANNPSGTGTDPNPTDGLFVANSDGTGVTQIFAENNGNPFPRFQAGTEVRQSTSNPNVFWAASLNGGNDGDFDSNRSSTLTRIEVDPGDFSNSSVTTVSSLDTAATGLGEDLEFVQGFAFDNDGNFYFGDSRNRSIYRAVLNATEDGFDSFDEIIDLDAAAASAGIRRADVVDVEFDPFRNKLVFRQQILGSERLPGEFAGIGRISEINLDGTGFNVLLDTVYVEDLAVIPAPASAALLGLGGLFAARRRR